MKKISALFILLLCVAGCAQGALVKEARAALGTIVEITVADRNKPRQLIQETLAKAFAEIDRIEAMLSRFNPQSEISRINAEANIRSTKVSSETIALLEKSIEFSRLTHGAFDITIYPLTETWGLAEKQGYARNLPEPDKLRQALEKVGYQKINIFKQEEAVFLIHPQMSLDLGAIAKGYAVDKAVEVLQQEGIENALVNAGGDIYALGRRGKSGKWRIAVQHPRKKGLYLTVLELEDQAVASSGDYERYIEIEGKRYSHIINPITGYPCQDVPASVTVLAENCLLADALATSIFVLGPKKGLELAERLENAEAIVVSIKEAQLDILLSQGLQGKLRF